LPTGAIIGIAVGAVGLAVASIFLYVTFYKRRRHRRLSDEPDRRGHPQPRNEPTGMVEVGDNDPTLELHTDSSHEMDADGRSDASYRTATG
jgi:hypothetical protein